MSTTDALTSEHMEFLAKCEEELKDRFTEKDEDFMKVFNAEPSVPPIIESWWVPNNRRNERHNNRRNHPYERHGGGGNQDRGNYDRRDRGNYDRRDRGDYDRRDRGNYDRRDRDGQYHDRRGYNDRGYEDQGHPGYNQRRY